jgi:hypothetical protein
MSTWGEWCAGVMQHRGHLYRGSDLTWSHTSASGWTLSCSAVGQYSIFCDHHPSETGTATGLFGRSLHCNDHAAEPVALHAGTLTKRHVDACCCQLKLSCISGCCRNSQWAFAPDALQMQVTVLSCRAVLTQLALLDSVPRCPRPVSLVP